MRSAYKKMACSKEHAHLRRDEPEAAARRGPCSPKSAGRWRGAPHREDRQCKGRDVRRSFEELQLSVKHRPSRRQRSHASRGTATFPLRARSQGQSHQPSAAGTLMKPATWRATRSPSSLPRGTRDTARSISAEARRGAAGATAADHPGRPRGRRDSRPPGAGRQPVEPFREDCRDVAAASAMSELP